EYTVTLHSAGVRDISRNANYMTPGIISTFRTPPAPAADLDGSGGAVGSVQIGALSFTAVRKGTDGELQVHRIGDTNHTEVVSHLSLPFFPRAIEAVGEYAYKQTTNGPVQTNKLILVAGGVLGTDNAGQVVWVVNVSDPLAPVRV